MRFYMSDQERFTRGDCHILARELNRRTGWPIYTFTKNGGRAWAHAFVKTPDGHYLDIEGLHTFHQIRRRWEAGFIKHWDSWEQLRDHDNRDSWSDGAWYGRFSSLRAWMVARRLVRLAT